MTAEHAHCKDVLAEPAQGAKKGDEPQGSKHDHNQ